MIQDKNQSRYLETIFLREWSSFHQKLELVSKELNHLAAILHVYAGVWILWSKKNLLSFFKKKMEILLHFLSIL